MGCLINFYKRRGFVKGLNIFRSWKCKSFFTVFCYIEQMLLLAIWCLLGKQEYEVLIRLPPEYMLDASLSRYLSSSSSARPSPSLPRSEQKASAAG